ncbi:DUF5343 domain-containing protein [Archaeoglobus neptunius]|uniref:DUF5343 domain-containing protein n=1 Tax=Archaeoglobus neptunius TaxID=2798580 RepID=UPI001E5285C9|nr:DUF5343 domain-containing protein [Archaeoglobus neptunius]
MSNFPYTTVPGKLKKFFKIIQETNVPEKVTQRWLAALGFKSSNDRTIVGLLKDLGFIDASGIPTETWNNYRNRELAPKIMASAIKRAYQQLFDTYPDAHRKDKEALKNFFAAQTNLASNTIDRIILTFKALCELADFEETESVTQNAKMDKSLTRPPTIKLPTHGLAININIQLQLPATNDEEVYDKLFRSLKRNLLSE